MFAGELSPWRGRALGRWERADTASSEGSLCLFFGRIRPGRLCRVPVFETEIDRGLIEHEPLPLRARKVDAIGVDDPNGLLQPGIPGLLRDLFEELLPKFVSIGRLLQAGQLLAQLSALYHALSHVDSSK